MKKNKGFSLIELMVVIAIVAILAVVALPAYKTYLIKSKLAMANNFAQSQIDASIRYYNENGVFGNIKQIGLPVSGDDNSTPDPLVDGYLHGYIAQLMMNENEGSACPSASAFAYVSNFGGGDISVDPESDMVIFQYTFLDKDDIIIKKCQYTYYQGGNMEDGVAMSGNYVADCVNTVDVPGNGAALSALIASCT